MNIVLSNINYTFKRGFLYVLLGPSGSGKSTLLHIIAKLLPSNDGTIELDNHPIEPRDVMLVLQQPFFYGDMTIGENIKVSHIFNKGITDKSALNYIETLQIGHILKQKANVCSGGEKARANLVRGLVANKKVLLIDEPTAHLDSGNSHTIANLLYKECEEKIVIVTTHEKEYFSFPQTIYLFIEKGNLYEITNPF